MKKGTLALVRRKGHQFSSFRRTKESPGNIQHVCKRADSFYVNPYFTAGCEAEEGPTA
jgi:hypothetical protein